LPASIGMGDSVVSASGHQWRRCGRASPRRTAARTIAAHSGSSRGTNCSCGTAR
jgi:hypothetical protein